MAATTDRHDQITIGTSDSDIDYKPICEMEVDADHSASGRSYNHNPRQSHKNGSQ